MPKPKNTKKSISAKFGAKSRLRVQLPMRKAKDLPASFGALDGVRKELKGDIAALRSDTQAGFKKVDARFNQVDAQLQEMNAKIGRMLALYEEQSTRNQASFEGAESV